MDKQYQKTMKEKQIKPTSGGKTYNNTKVDTSKRATQYRQKPKTTTTMKKQDKINSYTTFNKVKQQQYNNHLNN